jgi:hypothetical protein
MVQPLRYKTESRGFETQWGEWIFSIYLILPVTLAQPLRYKTESRGFETQWGEWIFSIYLILPVTLAQPLSYKTESRGFETQWGEWIFSIYLILPTTPHSCLDYNSTLDMEKLSPKGKLNHKKICSVISCFIVCHNPLVGGHTVALMVWVLCYRPEGRGFESRWSHWMFFNLPNPSSHTMGLSP